MKRRYSTREAAEKLGIAWITLQKHVGRGTFRVPPIVSELGVSIRLWSDFDLARVRKSLDIKARKNSPGTRGNVHLSENDKKVLKDEIGTLTTENLMAAFISLREYRKVERIPGAPVLTKSKHLDDMAKSLWAAYKDRFQKAVKTLGYDIGFLFQNDTDFKLGCATFRKSYPRVRPELLQLMEWNRSNWQSEFKQYRNNYIEHQTMDYAKAAAYRSLARAEMLFQRVWVSIEEITVMLLEPLLPDGFGFRELSEEERKRLPMARRFGWQLTKPFKILTPQDQPRG